MKKHKNTFNYEKIIDLHGYTLEEAVHELDNIVYSGRYSNILIIHGIGSGVLKYGIRQYLKEISTIKDVIFGEDVNIPGGSGITIIYL